MNGYAFSILSPELNELRLCQKYFNMVSNITVANNDENCPVKGSYPVTDDDVEKCLEAEENKNTRRKTDSDVALVSCKLLNVLNRQ